MKKATLILFLLSLTCALPAQERYTFSKGKQVGIGLLSLASFVDGFVEGYEFDNRSYFERKTGASPTGRFGSRSWERRYTHPNSWNRYMGVLDFYHIADDARKYLYISGSVTIGISAYKNNGSIKHHLMDAGISLLASSFFKSLGMRIVRHK